MKHSILFFVFFWMAAAGAETKIVLATSGPEFSAVAAFTQNGKFQSLLADYSGRGDNIRGLAMLDESNLIASVDGADRIDRVNTSGEVTPFVIDPRLSGFLGLVRQSPVAKSIAIIDSRSIEMFDPYGNRIGNPAVPTILGTCNLVNPKSLAFDQVGDLWVADYATGNILQYRFDRSGRAYCGNSMSALRNLKPSAMIAHSNGKLYVATQTDSQIFEIDPTDASRSPRVVWSTDRTRIDTPTAIAELPSGALLVASDRTNSIERVRVEDGVVDMVPFMRNLFTGLVTDILVTDW